MVIRDPLFLSNLAQIWRMGHPWCADFLFELNIPSWMRIELENYHFFFILQFRPSTCGYCRLKTFSNDALYNYTKVRKFHEPTKDCFDTTGQKPAGGHCK